MSTLMKYMSVLMNVSSELCNANPIRMNGVVFGDGAGYEHRFLTLALLTRMFGVAFEQIDCVGQHRLDDFKALAHGFG
jgi:hypothetical protein